MKKYLWFSIICVILISVSGCGKKAEKVSEEEVLAKIGENVITVDAFEKRLANLPDSIKTIARNNKAAYLENLIVETLLFNEAIEKKLDQQEDVVLLLKEAKKRILIARLAQDEIKENISVDERAVRSYYEENKHELESPEIFRASHILVDSLEEAAGISDRLNAGAIFEELARKHSKDVTSKRGGDIGYFSAGEMVPEFEDSCVRLKIGEISGPVKTEFGYHIIKLTDKRGPEPMKFEEVRSRIERILLTQKRGKLLEDLVEKLKAKTDVTINLELLSKVGAVSGGIAQELPSGSGPGSTGAEGLPEW